MTELEAGVVFKLDWPWRDEDIDIALDQARKDGKVLIETLGVVIEYEVKDAENQD